MNKKQKILFLCTRNSCRSQMAEGWLRSMADDRFEVFSAGVEPTQVHPLAIEVMKEAGIDIRGQSSKSVRQYLGKYTFAYIVSVCVQAAQQCPRIWPTYLDNMKHWPFDDPETVVGSKEEKLTKFREVRDQIRQKIKSWLEEMA